MSKNGDFEANYKDSMQQLKNDPNILPTATGMAGKIQGKPEIRNKRIQLLLTQSNYDKIKQCAESNNTSVNDAINQIINNYL